MKPDLNNACLFCGKQKQEKQIYESKYHECDCPDAKKDREIDKKIREMHMQIYTLLGTRPKAKYRIAQCLERIEPESCGACGDNCGACGCSECDRDFLSQLNQPTAKIICAREDSREVSDV